MKWSFRIGRILGIPIYMHATFVLLLIWIGLAHWFQERSLPKTLAGIGFILAIFLCVVLHEFGHALAARRFGIRTRDVTLLPIGGLARLERIPEEPRQELLVAAAGPLVNVAIAVVLAAWLATRGTFEPLADLSMTGGPFAERLFAANIFLVLFNLIPAFPMDGGRVLRALLATRLEYTRATQIAAGIGQACALVFGLFGLFGNPLLLFIALFVWIGAGQEASMVRMKTALGGIPIRRAMLGDFRTLAPSDRLDRAVELTLTGSQKDFPVLEGDRVVGILQQGDLLGGLARQGSSALVGEIMQREFQTVELSEMLESVLARLQECACHTVPITEHGRLVGLATMENIGEFLAIQSALSQSKGS